MTYVTLFQKSTYKPTNSLNCLWKGCSDEMENVSSICAVSDSLTFKENVLKDKVGM